MRISDWSSDVCSSDLQEFIETAPGNAVARVAEIFERRQRRALHAEHRTDVEEDRRPQPQFLRTGAERDIELDPPLIIGAPAERVVDLAAIVVAGVDHRIERIIGRGIAYDARTDAAHGVRLAWITTQIQVL